MSSVRMSPRLSTRPVATRRFTEKAPKGPLQRDECQQGKEEREKAEEDALVTGEGHDDGRGDGLRVHCTTFKGVSIDAREK